MTLQITVRGEARGEYEAEEGTVHLAVSIAGKDRADVARRAKQTHGELTTELESARSEGRVTRLVADAVRVVAVRPWRESKRAPVVQSARMSVQATFGDVEALSDFVSRWSEREEVEISSVRWDLVPQSRRAHEAALRAQAVADAVAKAQAYADAVSAGPVRPTHLSDPGMLSSDEPVGPAHARFAAAAVMGDELDLIPAKITLECEVDARFESS